MQIPTAMQSIIDTMDPSLRDPGLWRPMTQGLAISVPIVAGGRESGSITLNALPFIVTAISHQILGLLDGDDVAIQDGQYLVRWNDESSLYVNTALPADMLFGSVRTGHAKSLPFPIAYGGNSVVTFEVTNVITRTNGHSDYFQVYFALEGWANFGKPR